MAYSDFSLAKARDAFGLTLVEKHDLFASALPIVPSEILTTVLAEKICCSLSLLPLNIQEDRPEIYSSGLIQGTISITAIG